MIIVLENQSFLDIAIQEYGSVYAALDLAIANAMSITDDLVPGQKLKPVNSNFKIQEVADYFKSKKQNIATYTAFVPIVIDDYSLPGELPYSF